MNPVYKVKTIAVGTALLCAAMGSAGLTLGRLQGAAYVGRPLNVVVPVQFDSSEDAKSVCVEADVYYAETLVDSNRITATVEPLEGGSSLAGVVRVASAALINEPFVTVNLRAGCQQKLSKRFTLFADPVTSVVEPLARAPVKNQTALVDVPVVAVQERVVRSSEPQGQAALPRVPAEPKKVKVIAAVPTPRVVATQLVPQQPARTSKAAGKSRLKLDPLDLLIEHDPVLRASTELLTLPQEDLQKRAEAAAQWRALNASPEDLMREAAQARQIESAIKSLNAVTVQNQKALTDLASKVQRAESERYANGLVYSLVALLLASLAALVWMWRRQHVVRAPAWSYGLDAGESIMPYPEAVPDALPEVQPQPVSKPEPKKTTQPVSRAEPGLGAEQVVVTEVDFELDLNVATPSAFMALATDPADVQSRVQAAVAVSSQAPGLAAGARDFSASISGGLRAIDSEELMDVRHQAEFFMSLGEHEKAIEVLTGRIAQYGESSPIICLDLLKIYHSLGRQSEFDFMREEFNSWFAARVPVFSAFGDEGQALDHYPKVIERIVALWPDPRVLEYIEDCMFHHSGEDDGPVFDLQAYRDLLLLHGVAKRIVRLANGDTDSDMSELLRIPPRAQLVLVADKSIPASNRPVAHRAGAQFRGSWQRDGATASDPQDDIDTRGAPLGAMKVPPPSAPVESPDDQPSQPLSDSDRARLTDFNFLSLR